MSGRLAAQTTELKKSLECHSDDKKKLDIAGENAQKTQQEMMLLKRKVRIMVATAGVRGGGTNHGTSNNSSSFPSML